MFPEFSEGAEGVTDGTADPPQPAIETITAAQIARSKIVKGCQVVPVEETRLFPCTIAVHPHSEERCLSSALCLLSSKHLFAPIYNRIATTYSSARVARFNS